VCKCRSRQNSWRRGNRPKSNLGFGKAVKNSCFSGNFFEKMLKTAKTPLYKENSQTSLTIPRPPQLFFRPLDGVD